MFPTVTQQQSISKTKFQESVEVKEEISRKNEDEDEEAKDIAQRTGTLWECISRRREMSGHIYCFKIKEEYRQLRVNNADHDAASTQEKIKAVLSQIFPAIEMSEKAVTFLNPYLHSDVRGRFDYDVPDYINPALVSLGYESFVTDSVTYLELPDKEELLARWNILIEKLKVRMPELPLKPLKIISSSDVATDADFIHAYYDYDALLSTGKEMVHDHLFHLIPTLVFMLNSRNLFEKYEDIKKSNIEVIKKIYARIQAGHRSVDAAILKGKKTLVITVYDYLESKIGTNAFEMTFPISSRTVSLEELKKNLPKQVTALAIIADVAASKHNARFFDFNKLTEDVEKDWMRKLDNGTTNYFDYFQRRYAKDEYRLSLKRIWESMETLERAEMSEL